MLGGHRSVASSAAAALVAVVVLAGCGTPIGTAAPPEVPTTSSSVAAAPSSLPASPSVSPPDRPFRPTPGPSPTFGAYVVKPGDTLLGLADRFGTTATSLAYWNRARYPTLDPDSPAYAPDRIETGWTLAFLPGDVVDPENLPPAAESPQPRASPEPFPVLPADGSALLVTHGPRGSGAVALTFDDAGGAGAGAATGAGADAILQWLVVRGVAATVFVAPSAAGAGDPAGNAVLARLATAPASVIPGLLPPRPAAGTGWDAGLRAASAPVEALIKRPTAPWLRISGSLDSAALGVIGRTGWTWVIGADVESGDDVPPAAGGPIAADIAARVLSRASGGSIIRLTLGGAHTLEALPVILDGLAARGLRVVSLADLLGVTGR